MGVGGERHYPLCCKISARSHLASGSEKEVFSKSDLFKNGDI